MTNSPLSPLLDEINKAASEGLPFLAVVMTVALPDICASLISEDGRSNGERYKQWCADNLSDENFGFVTPDDLYSMRCGILHNGRFGDLKHSVARVIFALPGRLSIINCTYNDCYVYSVVDFCRNFTDCVSQWFEANKGNHILKANLPRMFQYRADGLPGFIKVPVLA